MSRRARSIWVWALALLPIASVAEVAHYSIRAALEPAAGELTATVQVQWPREQAGKPVEFLLAAPLQITSTSVAIEANSILVSRHRDRNTPVVSAKPQA